MPDYNKVYQSLTDGKTDDEVLAIKEQFKLQYDFDPDKAGKKQPVQTEGATAQENPAPPDTESQSSGDSSNTKDPIAKDAVNALNNFKKGKFKSEQKEAYDAYKDGDIDWHKKLPKQEESFEDLQKTIKKTAAEKFEETNKEESNALQEEVATVAQEAILNDPKTELALDTFTGTLDIEGKQNELITKYDLKNNPQNIEKAQTELEEWANGELSNFIDTSETFKGIQTDVYKGVMKDFAPQFEALGQKSTDFYGDLHEIDKTNVFERFLTGAQLKGGTRGAEIKLNTAAQKVNELKPGEEGYDLSCTREKYTKY